MITTAEEFVELRTSDDPQLYHRAAHDFASVEVWIDVLQRYPAMCFWVAQNKTVPIEILELLIHHDDWKVRHMIASKRKCPPALLGILALDEDSGVRHAVVISPRVPRFVLELLLNDSWESIASMARERLTKFAE